VIPKAEGVEAVAAVVPVVGAEAKGADIMGAIIKVIIKVTMGAPIGVTMGAIRATEEAGVIITDIISSRESSVMVMAPMATKAAAIHATQR
jgi:hypothetical protein